LTELTHESSQLRWGTSGHCSSTHSRWFVNAARLGPGRTAMVRRSTGSGAPASTGRPFLSGSRGGFPTRSTPRSSPGSARTATGHCWPSGSPLAPAPGNSRLPGDRCSHYCGRRTAGAFVTWTVVASGDGQGSRRRGGHAAVGVMIPYGRCAAALCTHRARRGHRARRRIHASGSSGT
jgi:hypothetical protein